MKQFSRVLKTRLYEIEVIGDYPTNYKPCITGHGTVDDTNLSQTLKIKIGARVMIVMNVNTSDSLVNGSLGVIIDIITDTEEKVKCIIIKFDSDKAGAEQRRKFAHISNKYKDQNGTPIFRKNIKYNHTFYFLH